MIVMLIESLVPQWAPIGGHLSTRYPRLVRLPGDTLWDYMLE
ncbi:MAG: hypothetical protein WD648_00770 [Planctomycetaceae bacterium]